MSPDQMLKWFDEIAQKKIQTVQSSVDSDWWYDLQDAVTWLTDAQSALEAVFPAGHAVIKSWQATIRGAANSAGLLSRRDIVDPARAVFRSAHNQLKSGRLSSLAEGILAESVSELLDQAQALNDKKWVVASAVVAGGALESHLLHLCRRNQLTWTGEGSIEKYNNAIGEARNKGMEIYSANDGKLVTAWGGIRNEAAHKPAEFKRNPEQVGSMILLIRDFVARHP